MSRGRAGRLALALAALAAVAAAAVVNATTATAVTGVTATAVATATGATAAARATAATAATTVTAAIAATAVTATSMAAATGSELAEGNRRFRGGDLEGALAAYASGYDPAHPDPLLAYNLGATAHRLGRLPEALLWYRRAQAHAPLALLPGSGDPWVAHNIALARHELGAPGVRPRSWARLAAWRNALLLAGCLLAWVTLLVLMVELAAGRRLRTAQVGRGVHVGRGIPLGRLVRIARPVALGLTGVALFGAGWLLSMRGPREAVLLAPCGDLPAGSEVWVGRADEESLTVLAGTPGPPCPAGALGLVDP